MNTIVEDLKNEFKEVLNDKLEKEVIAFLNKEGGNIYIGIKDNGEIIGVNKDIDKLQLEIKDRIKNNISPSTMGLFEIRLMTIKNKKIIQISIKSGSTKPYYLKEKGMTYDGCFTRVGNSVEHLFDNEINNLLNKRLKRSLILIESPIQTLTFSQLKIYYEELGYEISNNFFHQLQFFNQEGKYNYLAYLLADNNNLSIKIATYATDDVYDLIKCEEMGCCCLIKTTHNILNFLKTVNQTFTKIEYEGRTEQKMVNEIALKEALINAIVHNSWDTGNSPKVEIFSNHISISSCGGLPEGISEEDFYKGLSIPRYPELMKIFQDVDLVEHLGTGVLRILKAYDKTVFEFYPNFIRVNFPFKRNDIYLNKKLIADDKVTKLQNSIMMLIQNKPNITQEEMAHILVISRRTIQRNIKVLIDKKYIERVNGKKIGLWKILEKTE